MHSISIRHPYAFSVTDWLTYVTLRMSRHRDPMVCYPSIGPFFVHLTLDRFTRTLLHNMQKRKVLCSHICNRPLPSILLKVRIYVLLYVVLSFTLQEFSSSVGLSDFISLMIWWFLPWQPWHLEHLCQECKLCPNRGRLEPTVYCVKRRHWS